MRQLLCTLIVAGFALGLAAPALAADEKPKEGKKRERPNPEAFFKQKDTNEDGKLSKEEFLAGVPEDKAEKAAARFAKIDGDSDGYITVAEFKAAMRKHREKNGDGEGKRKKPKDDAEE